MSDSRRRGYVTMVLGVWVAVSVHVTAAQAQWTVTIRAIQNPLAVGQCTGIEVVVVDNKGYPPVRPDKKPASGWDFDLEFTAAAPDAFAWRDERHRFLCANAPTAPSAVVVARYPAQHLKPAERIPGLELQRSVEVAMQAVPAPAPVTSPPPDMPPVQPVPGYAPGSPIPPDAGALPMQAPPGYRP